MVSVQRKNIHTWKIVICSTSRKDVPWKIAICSSKKYTFLENCYLFDEQKRRSLENCDMFDEKIYLPGKLVSVQWTHRASWKSPEKSAPGRKEKIFSKIVSVAASYYNNNLFKHFFNYRSIGLSAIFLCDSERGKF